MRNLIEEMRKFFTKLRERPPLVIRAHCQHCGQPLSEWFVDEHPSLGGWRMWCPGYFGARCGEVSPWFNHGHYREKANA